MPRNPEVLSHATDWSTLELVKRRENEPIPSLKILLNGQGAFAVGVGNALLTDGHVIAGVIAPKPIEKKGVLTVDPLRQFATEHNIPIVDLGTIVEEEAQDRINKLEADLGVMAFVTKTVPPEVSQAPKYGTIQFHPGNEHGRSSQNWAIIEGDGSEKVNILAVEDDGKPEQLDSGRIVIQPKVEIPENITMSDMYKTALSPLGIVALRDAVRKIAYEVGDAREEGREVVLPYENQNGSLKPNRGRIEKNQVRINSNKPAIEIHNMIRGAQNSPAAWTLIRGKTVNLFDSELYHGPVHRPGLIEWVTDEGVTITGSQGFVKVRFMQEVDGEVKGPRMTAKEYINSSARTVYQIET